MPTPDTWTICAWCSGLIHDGDRSSGPSHGLCPACLDLYFPQVAEAARNNVDTATPIPEDTGHEL